MIELRWVGSGGGGRGWVWGVQERVRRLLVDCDGNEQEGKWLSAGVLITLRMVSLCISAGIHKGKDLSFLFPS